MKIIVLAGGLSPERDVSLSSASKISKALIRKGHEVCIIDLYYGINLIEDNLVFSSSEDDIDNFVISEDAPIMNKNDVESEVGQNIIKCCKSADIVFLALHGDIGENGKIQALLDIYKIKYTGSGYDGCFLSMNKDLSKIIISANSIKTAQWCVNSKDDSINYPCVVKPSGAGSSIGISIVNNDNELKQALAAAKKYDNNVLIEEKIEGREFSVGILDNKALPIIEIEPKNGFYDYKNKYQKGLTIETCPAVLSADITKNMQKLALKIHKLLHLNFYSRIDFIMDKNENIYFLEANSLPGMTPTSLLPQEANAAGISYEELCSKIALNALDKK